jgi:MvdD-like protein with pre-ATP grasp domain
MILILTMQGDRTADRVERELAARGGAVVRFDPAELPERAVCSLRFTAGAGWRRTIERTGAPAIDLAAVTSVWLRRPGARVAPAAIADPRARSYLLAEWRDVAADVFSTLACRWLPGPPDVVLAQQRKCRPLMLAHELGFAIPATALTSRPADLFELHRAHGGDIITKLPGPSAFPDAFAGELARYTERVVPRDLGHARELRWCPILIQENVAKRLEVRATVVGDRVFAAEIHSQASHRTRQDWRRYDHANTRYAIHALPAEHERRCVELTRRLGLCYGAIDLIVTPDGEYVFLEINPAGEYGWVEDLTRLPISEAICDLLLAGAQEPT